LYLATLCFSFDVCTVFPLAGFWGLALPYQLLLANFGDMGTQVASTFCARVCCIFLMPTLPSGFRLFVELPDLFVDLVLG